MGMKSCLLEFKHLRQWRTGHEYHRFLQHPCKTKIHSPKTSLKIRCLHCSLSMGDGLTLFKVLLKQMMLVDDAGNIYTCVICKHACIHTGSHKLKKWWTQSVAMVNSEWQMGAQASRGTVQLQPRLLVQCLILWWEIHLRKALHWLPCPGKISKKFPLWRGKRVL